MTPIELEWLHVKRDELWGEMFESGTALKVAVVISRSTSRAYR
jgi:hypothetical protein